MKKIVLLFLSMLILALAMTVAVSANIYYELADYGQKTYTVSTAEVAPIQDGVICEGEYTLCFEMTLDGDKNSDDYFVLGADKAESVEYVKLYLTQDEDNIYVGAELKDPVIKGYYDALYVHLSINDVEDYIQIYLPHCNKPEVPIGEDNTANWPSYYTGYGAANDSESQITVYEISIARTTLAARFEVDSFDAVLFLGGLRVSEDGSLMIVGFRHETLAADLSLQGAGGGIGYPHILLLGEDCVLPGEDTEPVVTESEKTEPAESESLTTEPTEMPDTDPADSEILKEPEAGCGATVSLLAVAIIASLGICVTFVNKRR